MADIEQLRSLRERVIAATGEDREIDAAVHLALLPDSDASKMMSGFYKDVKWELGRSQGLVFTTPNGGGGASLPAYTASLDAMFALRTQLLPNWRLAGLRQLVENKGGKWQPGPWDCELDDPNSRGWQDAEARTASLALLAALLSALIARAEERPDATD